MRWRYAYSIEKKERGEPAQGNKATIIITMTTIKSSSYRHAATVAYRYRQANIICHFSCSYNMYDQHEPSLASCYSGYTALYR